MIMKRFLLTAATVLAAALLVQDASAENFRAADIAKLPQDKVAAVKRDCARQWGDDFRMREYCENQQYQSMQRLIDRGSITPKGEPL